jgi:anti-sigma factor RsiW
MADNEHLSDNERDELIAYLDGEVDAETARGVEAKLNCDPRIRREAEALRKSYDLLDYLPRPQPSPSFTNRTMTRVSAVYPGLTEAGARPAWRRWALGAGWAAALLIAGVAGYATTSMIYRGKSASDTPAERDQQLVHDLRVIDNLRPYHAAGDINFLHELDRPELFGDEHAGY